MPRNLDSLASSLLRDLFFPLQPPAKHIHHIDQQADRDQQDPHHCTAYTQGHIIYHFFQPTFFLHLVKPSHISSGSLTGGYFFYYIWRASQIQLTKMSCFLEKCGHGILLSQIYFGKNGMSPNNRNRPGIPNRMPGL